MQIRRLLIPIVLIVMVAGVAAADLKVTKISHRDAFTMMGQTQPATDEEQTTWIGKDRMHMMQGDSANIVRLDTNTMTIINHAKKTYSVIDLPIDLEKFMPPGMAEQMKAMMTFEATVTPTDEHKTIGEWNARRYDIEMKSQMMTMTATWWATTDVALDQEAFGRMYEQVVSMQPGMAAVTDEMKKIKGLVIEQDTTITMTMMGDNSFQTSERTTAVEELDPPAGTYDPPADYTENEFNFMETMQQ